jgi:hypothetical protein
VDNSLSEKKKKKGKKVRPSQTPQLDLKEKGTIEDRKIDKQDEQIDATIPIKTKSPKQTR